MILKDRVAVITGAGQGLGRAFALALAQEGARVAVNDLMPELGGTADETVRAIETSGGKAMAAYGDVSKTDDCEKLIQAALDSYGTVDILINNAGINRDRMVWKMSEEEWDVVINVILKGTFNCTKYAAAHMREKRRGRIINITSQAGLEGNAGQPNYSAAKGGVVGFTKSCALALGRYGITVNAISPQADTRLWRGVTPERAREMGVVRGLVTPEEAENIPDEEVYTRIFGAPDDVAPIVVYLSSDKAADINGQVFFSSGGRISLYAPYQQIKSIYKQGRWTYEELASLIPSSLAAGMVNPAPAEPPPEKPD